MNKDIISDFSIEKKILRGIEIYDLRMTIYDFETNNMLVILLT